MSIDIGRRVTERAVGEFERSLARLDADAKDRSAWIRCALREAFERQLAVRQPRIHGTRRNVDARLNGSGSSVHGPPGGDDFASLRRGIRVALVTKPHG